MLSAISSISISSWIFSVRFVLAARSPSAYDAYVLNAIHTNASVFRLTSPPSAFPFTDTLAQTYQRLCAIAVYAPNTFNSISAPTVTADCRQGVTVCVRVGVQTVIAVLHLNAVDTISNIKVNIALADCR